MKNAQNFIKKKLVQLKLLFKSRASSVCSVSKRSSVNGLCNRGPLKVLDHLEFGILQNLQRSPTP